MKSILVIGMGRFGRHVVMKLRELGHEVMAIDRNEECIQEVLPYTTNSMIGDSTNESFIRSLGVGNFDVCIVSIGDDFQSSLETTSLLKEAGAKRVVARASRDVHAKFLLRNGADHVVYPEKQLATWTAIRYSADHILDYIEIDREYAVFEVTVPEKWKGHTIGELNIRRKYGVNVMAIRRAGGMYMDIHAETRLEPDDSILVLGRQEEVQKCFKL